MRYSALVGAVLCYAGIAKAIDVRSVQRTLSQHFPLIPCDRVRLAGSALVWVESTLGALLVVGAMPNVVLPVGAAFLLVVTGFSVRSLLAGRTEDCGCYGGIRIPTAFSIGLNALYLGAIAVDFRARPPGSAPATPVAIAALFAGLAVGAIAWMAKGRVLVDLSVVRPGRRWSPIWGGDTADFSSGEHMIFLMRPSCAHCEVWVPFVNIYSQLNPEITATGFVPGDSRDALAFTEGHAATFRVAGMPAGVFDSIVFATPTAVQVREGRIVHVWSGNVPQPLVAQAQQYYTERFVNEETVAA